MLRNDLSDLQLHCSFDSITMVASLFVPLCLFLFDKVQAVDLVKCYLNFPSFGYDTIVPISLVSHAYIFFLIFLCQFFVLEIIIKFLRSNQKKKDSFLLIKVNKRTHKEGMTIIINPTESSIT